MCGVVGLIGSASAAREAFLGLTTLQHRGQDAAGILSFDRGGFHRVRSQGLVESVFNRENMDTLTGSVAIGHARYSTIGRGDVSDVQPFVIGYPYGIGMVHNGNIVNCERLAGELKRDSRRHLLTHSDTETVLNLFADALARAPASSTAATPLTSEAAFASICSAVQEVFTRVNGSYSIVTLIADQGLVAFRDPYGIRPLVWGRRKAASGLEASVLPSGEAHMLASESVALSFLGYEPVRDIAPGEVIFIDLQGNVHTRVLEQKSSAHCMFEWVYFASPESEIDGVPVYGARIELGRSLGGIIREQMRERGFAADIVVPVPETSRIAAIALSEELGIPYREVLIKNRYIKRTFILDSQEKRQKAVNLKLSPVRSEIEGKRVLLVDDSIVRGTTSRKIIELVRQAGASKVYFVSTCPPIQHPCYYGIDFPDEDELIAAHRSHEQIERELGADAVIYQDIPGLKRSIQKAAQSLPAVHALSAAQSPSAANARSPEKSSPCMACLNGCYPTDVSSGQGLAANRRQDRKA